MTRVAANVHHRTAGIAPLLLSGMLMLFAPAGCVRRTSEIAPAVTVEQMAPAAGADKARPQRAASERLPGDPIRLAWVEGDVAGMTSILSPDGGSTIGFVDYHQHLRGDVLEVIRIARFSDGSSDEDRVEARIGKTLRTLRGRSVIRNSKGVATVDMTIDAAGGHITGFSGLGAKRQAFDERVDLPPDTYWGPLVFIVIKNFEQNAVDGRLVFRTVVATPKPRIIDMELVRHDASTVVSRGAEIQVVRFALRPTVNWLIDPIIRMLAPKTDFLVQMGAPPSLVRFEGPRNYADQKIRIE